MDATQLEYLFTPLLKNRCLRVAYGLTRNLEDAQDLVGEAIYRLLRANVPASVVSSEPVFQKFLMRTIHRIWIDETRKRNRQPTTILLDISVHDYVEPSNWLGEEPPLIAIWELLTLLPVQHAEAIWLLDVEDITDEQASVMIGINKGTLRSRAHRARRQLRTTFRQHTQIVLDVDG